MASREARFVGHRDDPGPFGLAQSVMGQGDQPPAADHPAAKPSPAFQRRSVRSMPPSARPERAGRLPRKLVRCRAFRIWRPCGGSCVSPSWKTAESFFDSTSKRGCLANALSSCDGAPGSNSLTRRRSRRELPQHWLPAARRGRRSHRFQAIQFRRIQPLLAAPGAARRLIHCCCDDHRLQPRHCCPARAAGGGSTGQCIRPPAFQRRNADPHVTRHQVDRRTLRRQQPRHYPIFMPCPYRAILCYPRPPRFRSYLGGNFSDTGGP